MSILTEYDEERTMQMFKEEYREEGREEGVQIGREEGQNILGTLMTKLLDSGRTEDVRLAAQDPAYREKLYKEFKITEDSFVLNETTIEYKE